MSGKSLTISEWQAQPAKYAESICEIHDVDGTWVEPGRIGEVVDVDSLHNSVMVDFGDGAVPCWPNEIVTAARHA